jgi:hypothetical protein
MSMSYIRTAYQVPAKRGGRVRYIGTFVPLFGTIVGATKSGHLKVRMDGDKRAKKYHPTWLMTYLTGEKGAV